MEDTARKISLSEAFKFAWPRAIDNLGFFVVFLTIYFIFTICIAIIEAVIDNLLITFFLEILSTMVDIIIGIGLITAGLAVFKGQRVTFDHIFENTHLFWRYLGANILLFLIIVGGLILFIIPGIIWMLRFSFCMYLIVDKNMKIMDALKESYRLTKGHTMDLIGYGLLAILVSIAGFLALIMGIYIAIPLINFMYISLYKQLLGEKQPNGNNGNGPLRRRPRLARVKKLKTIAATV